MCVLTPHATAQPAKKWRQKRVIFQQCATAGDAYFHARRSFYCPKEARTPAETAFFSCSGVLLPSAADFFQSACVCNRLCTTDAPVADPCFFSKSECENHFLRQRELMKKMEKSARILRFVEKLIGFFTRPQEALGSE
jgi:hypothetical protein